MRKSLMLALLLSSPAIAAPSDFAAMDADRDGRVSAREHAAAAAKMFKTMDADGDGKVTAAEMDAASPGGGLSAAEKIKVVDSDRDGVLTAKEHVRASRTMFLRMDKDKDGSLSEAEFDAGHAMLKKKKQKS